MNKASASHSTASKTDAPLGGRRPYWLPVAVLVVATLLAYASAVPDGFVWIDHVEILEAGYRIENAQDFRRLWYLTLDEFLERHYETGHTQGGYWRPLYALSISLDWFLWKDRAWCYHVENILWHMSVVLGLYALGLHLGRGSPSARQLALWAALLFAVHPLGVHSVTWISGRKDTMCAAFAVAALLAFAKTVPSSLLKKSGATAGLPSSASISPKNTAGHPSSGTRFANKGLFQQAARDETRSPVFRWPPLAVALGCTLLALLCKELAAVVPLVATLIAWPTLRPGGKRLPKFVQRLLALGSLWSLVALWGVYRVTVLSGLGLNARYPSERWVGNVATSATLWWHYLGRALFPIRPSISDAWPISNGLGGVETAAVAGLLAAVALTIYGIRRGWPGVSGILWYVVWMLPATGIVPLRHFRAERYLYLAMWGLMFAFVTIVIRMTATPRQRRLPLGTTCLFAAVAGWFLITTATENFHWTDDETLFNHSLLGDPRHVEARLGLAHLALERQDFEEAVVQSRLAIRTAGESSHTAYWSPFLAHSNLGLALYYQGRYVEAREAFNVALKHRPQHATAHYHVGLAAYAAGDLPSAKDHYLASLERNPTDFLCRGNLGATWLQLNNPRKCIEILRSVIDEEPDNITNLSNFASAMLILGNFAEALPHFERLTALAPNEPAHRAKLAWCQWETGARQEAVQTIRQTLRQAPSDPTARSVAQMLGVAPDGGQ